MTGIPTEIDLRQQRIHVDGTWNLRDVGGYATVDGRRTRAGVLYRSDALHRLDDDGRRQFAALGIRTVVDLRRTTEHQADPDLVDGTGARVVCLPLFDTPEGISSATAGDVTLMDVYRWLVTDRGAAIAAVVRELAVPGALPALVHCMGGKDRTGIVVALVLAAIGVDDRVIAADYAATGLFMSEERRAALLAQGSLGHDPGRLSSDPELILGALATARRGRGSVGAYLMAHGVLPAEIDRLRCSLLDGTGRAGTGRAGTGGRGGA